MGQPAGRVAAPPPLDRIQDFVNSVDLLDGVADLLIDSSSAAAWLCAEGHTEQRVEMSETTFANLLEIRGAIRALCQHNRDPAVETNSAIGVLNASADRCELLVDFAAAGRLRSGHDGVDGFVGSILSNIQVAMIDGTWRRLKACRGCGWVYHDNSRSRIGQWCSMAICGNRAKNRAHRRRHTSIGDPCAG